MNLLDLVPALKRQVGKFVNEADTDSILAGYLADAVHALNWRWSRDYVVTNVIPNTYTVDPDITDKDIRPIVLMASIIYKMGNVELAGFRDGDFVWDPQQGRNNPLTLDISELDKILPMATKKLALAKSAPLRGFSNAYTIESYQFLVGIGVLGSI